jgi:uncharacterized repeat protein (TIGR02543 family)
MKQKWIILTLLLITAISSHLYPAVFCVRTNGSDLGDGRNWTTQAMSSGTFARALLAAQPGDTFLLAEGVYYPYYDASGNVPSDSRFKTFFVRPGVTVRGGFDADGNPGGNDLSRAVLSGNIGSADVSADNVYNVVTFADNSHGASLQMLTVTGGYGNGGGEYSRGAGIFVRNLSGMADKPVFLSRIHVTDNRSDGHGCGIFIDNGSVVKIEHATISNNTGVGTSDVWGGGISVWNNAEVNVDDCIISGNTASHGGGVHVLRATYNSRNSKYANNTSDHGGAFNVYLTSDIHLNSDSILNNRSRLGGGVHNETGVNFVAGNTVFKGNTAETGGGFYNRGGGQVVCEDCVFEDNEAEESGGGIENRGEMEINRSRITRNHLTGTAKGGGIRQNGGNLVVRQSEISDNTAMHGGGMYMEGGKATVSNTTISGNTAAAEGGAINCHSGSLALVYATVTNNTAPANAGSGIWMSTRPEIYNSIISGNANEENTGGGFLYDTGTGQSSSNLIGADYYPAGNRLGTFVNFKVSACLKPLDYYRGAGTRTHALLWQYSSRENPAAGQAVKISLPGDPTYTKDQTGKNRGNRPSLGAYEEDLFKAFDIQTSTELNTPVTIDIGRDNAVPEACTPAYTLLPGMTALRYGQVSYLNGTFFVYSPYVGARGTDTIYYRMQCDSQMDTACVTVSIAEPDRPANIKDETVCMEDMTPIHFEAKEKYRNESVRLDGFSMPLVGDLNGDRKPEVIALGLGRKMQWTDGSGWAGRAWYVHVFDGQTGERIHSVNLGTEPATDALDNVTSLNHTGITDPVSENGDQFQLRFLPRHNSPSHLAVADLDNDGTGEIVVVECGSLGQVYALSPTLDQNGKIVGFSVKWYGKKGGAAYSFKAPLERTASSAASSHIHFGSPMPYIADLNEDGMAEVIVYNKIFNGKTGELLLELETLNEFNMPRNEREVNTYNNNKNPAGGGYAYVGRRPGTDENDNCIPAMTVIDIDDDGVMEIIAGSKIYKPNIAPGSNSTSGNTYRVIHGPKSVTYPRADNPNARQTIYLSDGYTAVADIDDDGQLDIIVQTDLKRNNYLTYGALIYVWSLADTENVKAVVAFTGRSLSGTMSIPFVGDINGRKDDFTGTKKLPEICFNTGVIQDNLETGARIVYHPLSFGSINANKRFNVAPNTNTLCGHIVGFTYHANPNGSTPVHERLKLSWVMEHGDESAHTGITMFDFDADDIDELVYRDETSLRVISPARKIYVPVNEPVDTQNGVIRFREAGIRSYTGFEAPVIADINDDASADILTLAYPSSEPLRQSYGNLYVYEADAESWAPARPVWNQGIYFPLQINDDLTVPRHPISTLAKFVSQQPGHAETDTIQPYNANWVQQPIVRENNYIPVLYTPDLSLDNLEIVAAKSNPDSVTLRLTVENRGAAAANTNTPITFYMMPFGSKNISDKYTIRLNVDMYSGERYDMDFTIPGDKTGKTVYARLVDDGMATFPAAGFVDCDPGNNIRYTYMISAADDYYTIVDDNMTTFDIRKNDAVACNVLPEIIESPRYGFAGINADSLLTYVSLEKNSFRDTLRYVIRCERDGVTITDTARVYFIINSKPDNIVDADCSVTPPATTVWGIRETALNKSVLIHNYGPLTVGDIDGDGTVEIIGYRDTTDNLTANGYESPGIKIFYFDAGANQVKLKREFSFSGATSATLGSMAIARYNNRGYIVVAGTDKYLYAYDAEGRRIWRSNLPYHTDNAGTMPGIVDFNNDGIPEVYTGNQIFSLTNGSKLCDGGTGNKSGILAGGAGHSSAVADMDGDGTLEIVAGVNIYKVNITNNNGTAGNSIDTIPGWQFKYGNANADGATLLVDIDNDGALEVVLLFIDGGKTRTLAWKPLPNGQSYLIGQTALSPANAQIYGMPVVGNIDDDVYPEIVFIESISSSMLFMTAINYAPGSTPVTNQWLLPLVAGDSGYSGLALFDFNQDGRNEIVYRNRTQLRIYDGSKSGTDVPLLASFNNVRSGALREFPVIADVDNDGQAEIIVTGWDGVSNTVGGRSASAQNGYLRVFKANGSPWAPARTVWNRYSYSASCVNEDLTIPQYPLNPATAFPGLDGTLGTSDDLRPYSTTGHQQTTLDRRGMPVWTAPDVIHGQVADTYVSGNTISITLEVSNRGDAAIRPPVYVTVYKDSVSGPVMATDSLNEMIRPGETGRVTVSIPDINPYLPFLNIVARINDNNGRFPYQPECDTDGSERMIPNPLIHRMMKKTATLNSVQNNGYYANPVSVLFNERIKYGIEAIHASYKAGRMTVRDTLPAYLNYVAGTAQPAAGFAASRTAGTPVRDVLTWTLASVVPMDTRLFEYEATPDGGVCASQPLFINRAWIMLDDAPVTVATNSTYHQGAGASIVTFSSGYGGRIYNADPQVVDYRTSARSGVLVVPDEGYVFAGWSHDDYVSLRGEQVQARMGITDYDTLTVSGNVRLTASFEPDEYPICYYLNGGENAAGNPPAYTVESGAITLEAPRKAGDVFVGWTGSNGKEPQKTVTIPKGSTGELELYANFLHSGRENVAREAARKDKIWSAGNELYIHATKTGSIVRIYTTTGALYRQHTIIADDVTKIKLEQGIYIVTLNNGTGQSIIIR